MKADLLKKMQSVDPAIRDILILMMEEFNHQSNQVPVARADFEELKGIVKDLAVAQNRTEQRLESLTARVDELAQAQKRTELIVQKLSESVVDIRKQMGGLAMAVGYGIEDRLMPQIPEFVDTAFGIRADIVDRRNIVYPDGSYDEANIYVEGEKNGNRIYLIGECKAQPGKRDFDKFAGLLGRIRENSEGDVMGMMIGYHYAPDVEKYAKENYPAIKFYRTFEVARGGEGDPLAVSP